MRATESPANRVSPPNTGRFATLRAFLHVKWIGAPSLRPTLLALLTVLALAPPTLLVTAAPAPALAAEPCPNEQFRTGFSASLPDCRAYEMVSPLASQPFNRGNFGSQASVSGDRMGFYAPNGASAGSPSFGPYYLSARRSSGWSTEDAIPPQTTAGGILCTPVIFYSLDLSKGVLADGWNWGEGYPRYPDDHQSSNCSHDEPELVPGEPRGFQNLFLRDNETASYGLIDVTPQGVGPRDAWFQSGSSDFSHIVFTDPAKLTPEAPTVPGGISDQGIYAYAVGEDLYEWVGGVVRLVTVLPGGAPVWGLLANGFESQTHTSVVWTHAVSADGERVFFYAGGEAFGPSAPLPKSETYVGGGLYLREKAAREQSSVAAGKCTEPAKACTVQIDAAESGAPGPSGGGHFQWATPDGSKAFFTDESQLTAGSKAEAGKPDLYEYEVNPEAGKPGTLTDLTAGATEPADVQGLSGISDDGSSVYFVAEGALTGEQENSQGAKAHAGKPNLYLRHAGATTFIATLDTFGEDSQGGAKVGDSCDWESYSPPGQKRSREGAEREEVPNCMSARVSPNGAFLAFNSLKSLTGYDNIVAGSGERDHEIFLYEAAQNKLSCASCEPEGAPPTAEAAGSGDPRIESPTHDETFNSFPTYLPHQLTDTGQVFFTTQNKLLPGDVNGLSNVYEYQGGRLSLISSGTGSGASRFKDASVNGNNLFFTTTQALVRSDTDNTLSLYDARVNGGFAEPPPPSEPCEGEEACHGPFSAPPVASSPASAAFSGPGNLTPPEPKPAVKPKQLTRAQKLAKALKACRKRPRGKRAACEKQARRTYGPARKAGTSANVNGRGK